MEWQFIDMFVVLASIALTFLTTSYYAVTFLNPGYFIYGLFIILVIISIVGIVSHEAWIPSVLSWIHSLVSAMLAFFGGIAQAGLALTASGWAAFQAGVLHGIDTFTSGVVLFFLTGGDVIAAAITATTVFFSGLFVIPNFTLSPGLDVSLVALIAGGAWSASVLGVAADFAFPVVARIAELGLSLLVSYSVYVYEVVSGYVTSVVPDRPSLVAVVSMTIVFASWRIPIFLIGWCAFLLALMIKGLALLVGGLFFGLLRTCLLVLYDSLMTLARVEQTVRYFS